ncbi:hypothetical protein, partial [Aeribacillus composti]|uniref:hypothetical protein n=1 Tax=Aeribacillus composti TaxID=1868734 RepID=UPI002E1A6E61|nr:hypothetical protein [Aeribacillus composti]
GLFYAYDFLVANSEDFSKNTKKDYLVCQHKKQIRAYYFKDYSNQQSPKKLRKSLGETCHFNVIKRINGRIIGKRNLNEVEELLKFHTGQAFENYRIYLAKMIKSVISKEEELNTDKFKNAIKNIVIELSKKIDMVSNKDIVGWVNNLVKELIQEIKRFSLDTEQVNLFKDSFTQSTINVGTIHSVKGETHRSTLLVESFHPKGFITEEKQPQISQVIRSIFINEEVEFNFEKKYLIKQIYVALSRPTYLAAIALPLAEFSQNEIEKLKDFGFQILNLEELDNCLNRGITYQEWLSSKIEL